MLGYLDALITALSLRDAAEAERLLAHPLARLLPPEVCDEAGAISAGHRDLLAVPLRTMQLRRQTAELLHEAPALADGIPLMQETPPPMPSGYAPDPMRDGPRTMAAPSRPRRGRQQQMELPLSA
jgi:hypothetical protein